MYLVKMDAAKNVIWSKQVPGSVHQDAKAMAVDAEGNVFIAGYFFGSINLFGTVLTGPDFGSSAYVCKFNEAGTFVGARSIKSVDGSVQPRSIDCDAMGNVIVGGDFQASSILFDGISVPNLGNPSQISNDFIAKYDADVNILWARTVGSTKSGVCAFDLAVDDNNDIYITTGIQNDSLIFANDTLINLYPGTSNMMLLAKFNGQGEKLWARAGKAATSNSGAYGMAVTSDNARNVYVGGTYYGQVDLAGQPALGNEDVFVAKYNSEGNLTWSKTIATASTEHCKSIAVDHHQNVFATGFFNTPFLNLEGTTYGNSGWASSNIFLVKYDSLGNTQWADAVGGNHTDQPGSLCTDHLNNVYLTGFFQSESILFGNSGLVNDSSTTSDAFITKITGGEGVLNIAPVEENSFVVFPNPFSEELNITMHESVQDGKLTFFDTHGNILRELSHVSGNQIKLLLNDIPAGVYFITLVEGGIPVLRQKVVSVK